MKKVLSIVLCMMMLVTAPLAVSAKTADTSAGYKKDPSVSGTYDNKGKHKGNKKSKSPKTGDYSMAGVALVVCVLSCGAIVVSDRKLKRA